MTGSDGLRRRLAVVAVVGLCWMCFTATWPSQTMVIWLREPVADSRVANLFFFASSGRECRVTGPEEGGECRITQRQCWGLISHEWKLLLTGAPVDFDDARVEQRQPPVALGESGRTRSCTRKRIISSQIKTPTGKPSTNRYFWPHPCFRQLSGARPAQTASSQCWNGTSSTASAWSSSSSFPDLPSSKNNHAQGGRKPKS